MTSRFHRLRQGFQGLLIGMLLAQGSAHGAAVEPASRSVIPGEFLSDWILRQPDAPSLFFEGLMWRVPAEKPMQEALKADLLAQAGDSALGAFVAALPVTGRVPVPEVEPRWLQAHPPRNPMLKADHAVLVGPRPVSVTVLLENGRPCHLRHMPGAIARDYLATCLSAKLNPRPWAWVAHADGQTRKVGLQAWNLQAQDRVSPGAWIWAPPPEPAFDDAFSQKLISFLATQGPSRPVFADADRAGQTPWMQGPTPRVPGVSGTITRGPVVSASDWGSIGLLQTPTARQDAVGAFRFHTSLVQPYSISTVMFQPLDMLEAGFRYVSIRNRDFGITDRDYTDKSFEVKLRLLEESSWLPQVALGLRDISGTGLFAGEYLVASKRFADFDWSAGLGWGYVGGRGSLRNPLGFLSDQFDVRPSTRTAQGGSFKTDGFFRGRVSPFGGVQWHTPIDALSVKVEYDGNDYRNEPLVNPQTTRSPVNIGVVYRLMDGADLSVAVERGNRVMVGLSLYANLANLSTPKAFDRPAARADVRPKPASPDVDWARTSEDLSQVTGWQIVSLAQSASTLTVNVEQVDGVYLNERLERMVSVLHRDAPFQVKKFSIQLSQRGMAMSTRHVDREAWVLLQTRAHAPAERPKATADAPPDRSASEDPVWKDAPSPLTLSVNPYLNQILGGPDAFLLYQAGLSAAAEFKITDRAWLSGVVNARLLDNFDRFEFTAPSNLPRVRTFQREYATTSRLTLPNLQFTQVFKVSDNSFASVYGGLLESMFAGAGGEWLYRPWHSPVAFGVDVNRVRQRGFRQNFELMDYEVTTGHASVYWDTGFKDIQTVLSAGQYLAGDKGATLDVSRRFDNGVVLGVYATKTNVSAAQFGEGGFDKGLYLSIPFDAMLARSSTEVANLLWSPLTRDGGARLARRFTLYELTSARDGKAMVFGPPRRTP